MALLLVHSDDTEVSPSELEENLRMFIGVEYVEIRRDDESLLKELGVQLMNLENIHELNCPIRELRLKIERRLGTAFTAIHPRTGYSGNTKTACRDIRLKIGPQGDREAIKGVLENIRGIEEIQE